MYEKSIIGVVRISKIKLVSVLVMFSCIDIEYLNVHIHGLQTLTFYLRVILLGVLVVKIVYLMICHKGKHIIGRNFILITLFFILIVISSLSQGQKMETLLYYLSYAYLPVILLDLYRKSPKWISILNVWEKILFAMVLVDAITMILMPQGLYTTSSYEANWFLGYKTMRLVYSLPLCVFRVILDYVNNRRKRLITYLIFLLTIMTLLYSKASAAAIGAIIIFIIFLICDYSNRLSLNNNKLGKIVNKFVSRFFSSYTWTIPAYLVIVYIVMNITNYKFIQYIVKNWLNKDITLTNRTVLWNSCIELINQNKWLGYGYLTPDNYRELFNNIFYTSPHNMILSVLITAGAVGTLCYFLIIIDAMRKLYKKNNIVSTIIIMGIICKLIVGITSSALVFCFCGFLFEVLSEVDFDNYMISHKKNSTHTLHLKG